MHLSPGQEKLGEILSLINNDYVDEVSIDSLIEQSLPDLIANLDPHSNYIPAKDLKAVNDELEGSFSGIGISFTMFTDTITVNEGDTRWSVGKGRHTPGRPYCQH